MHTFASRGTRIYLYRSKPRCSIGGIRSKVRIENVRASIKFAKGELFKLQEYGFRTRIERLLRLSAGLRSMGYDQSPVHHRRIEHLRGGIWQLRFHWEPFNPVCFVPLFRYSFQRRWYGRQDAIERRFESWKWVSEPRIFIGIRFSLI